VLVRIERPAGDPDYAGDPFVGLEQRHEAEAKRAGRTGNGDCELDSAIALILPWSNPASLHADRFGGARARHEVGLVKAREAALERVGE